MPFMCEVRTWQKQNVDGSLDTFSTTEFLLFCLMFIIWLVDKDAYDNIVSSYNIVLKLMGKHMYVRTFVLKCIKNICMCI